MALALMIDNHGFKPFEVVRLWMNSMRAWLFCSTDAISLSCFAQQMLSLFLGYSSRAFSHVCWDLVDRCGWSCGYVVHDDSLYAWVGLFSIASQEFRIQARSPSSFTKSIFDYTIQFCEAEIQIEHSRFHWKRRRSSTSTLSSFGEVLNCA